MKTTMEPRIQYAKSKDGVSIACWTQGEGRPLLVVPTPQWGEWPGLLQLPEARSFWERLARGRRLVLYSARGTGQSDRGVTDYSLEAQAADLEAVVDRVAAERFDMMGQGNSSPAAITYAAQHPERVEHLVLWHPWASGRSWAESPWAVGFASLPSIAERDWDHFQQTMASFIFSGATAEFIRRAAQVMGDSVTAQDVVRIFDALTHYEVTELLEYVQAPTVVLMRRNFDRMNTRLYQAVPAGIPGAQLVVLEGYEPMYFLGDAGAVVRTIRDFLGDERAPWPSAELPSGTAVILFADIAESTALTESLGDAAFREKARELGPSIRSVVRECSGTPIEGPTLGDGVLATFTSAREAITAALRCVEAAKALGLALHLGLHAGDVTREKDPDGRDNVYGGAVNIASRISGLSAPGEVVVSETVRSLARTSAGVRFEDRGELTLKGVGEPVRVWAVREAE